MREYTLVGRQTSGTQVIGYVVIENKTGCVMPMLRDTVYKLALNKKITDVTAQEYLGKITMKGNHFKISELPEYDQHGKIVKPASNGEKKLYIVYKVVDGKSTIGYGINVVQNGVVINTAILKREQVLQLAKAGAIANARSQYSNGKIILRGVDCNINSMPSYTIAEISKLEKAAKAVAY